MSNTGLHIDNKSWLARRDGYVGTIAGDEIPGGLDNAYLRQASRRLDDFEVTTYATDAALRVEWGVDAGATLPTLSTAANALRGDASLQIVGDAATAAVFREFAHERFGYAYPGGSQPVFDTSTGIGSFLFGPIRGIRFRATHSGTGAVTIHLIARNSGGTILRRWDVEIDTSGDTMHFIDFTATPDGTAGTWDETVVDEIAFGNLQDTVTYRFDDIDFIVESNLQDILYEVWRVAGTGGGGGLSTTSSLQFNRSYPASLEVSNAGTWSLELFNPAGGTTIATTDITPGTYVIDRIRQGAVTSIVGATTTSESAGTIFVTYTAPLGTWEPGDLIRVTFSGMYVLTTPNVLLTANTDATVNIEVEDADQFEVGWEVTISDTATPDGEVHIISEIADSHRIVLDGAITGAYTTANSARIRRSASFDPVIFFTPVTMRDTILELQEAWMISDYDLFDVADATADTERWTSDFISGTEGGTADINTTTAGQLRVAVDPDATPTAAEYGVRRNQPTSSRFFQTVVDANIAFGTLAATDTRAGMLVSRGAAFDTNNFVRVYKEDSTGITLRITAEANFGGGGATETNVNLTDNIVGMKIERIGDIWRCYYSTEIYPDYAWILIAEFEDTNGDMTEQTSTYLTAFSGGTVDAQSVTVDFDNWFYYVNSSFLEQMYGVSVVGTGVFTTGSPTVPADTSRTEADNYWNGLMIMPTAGAVAFQPRTVVNFASAGDVFTIDPENPFTAPTGTVPYVLLAYQYPLEPGTDATSNSASAHVVGSKADTPDYTATATASSLQRLVKGILGVEVIAEGTLTADSATLPADTGRGEVNNYWNGCWLMTVAGAVAFQPRLIASFANAGGVFTLDSEQPFTGVPGTSLYVILSRNSQLVPAANSSANQTPAHVSGNKSDVASVAAGTASIIARLRGIETALSVNAAAGGEFEIDGSPDIWDALVVDTSSQADIITTTGDRDGAIIERLAAIIAALNITDAGTGSGLEEDGASNLVTALGTDGVNVTDSALSVLGAVGANNANNAFDSSSVVVNEDGSVLERLQGLLEDHEAVPEVQEVIIYPVAIHQGTTELVNDGAAPPFVADTVQSSAAAISEGTAEAAWSELIQLEQEGTITIISIYAEFEFQSRFINNAGAGTNSNSKIQMTNDGGSTYVDVTDNFVHTGTSFVTRVRAGIGRWFTTVTAGTNQLGFRLVQWSDDAGGVDRSEANIRTNSYCRITYVKS